MAQESSILNELIKKAQLLEDPDWESFANRGMVRKAKKDLVKETITNVEEKDEGITLSLKTYKIRIPKSGFSKAECSCPAAGMCHHIVMCGLYLADLGNKGEGNIIQKNITADGVKGHRNWMLDLSLKELIAWSGIQNFRNAYEFIKKNDDIKIDEREKIRISFPLEDVEITCFYDSGPDGMIIPGGKKPKKMIGLAAVLAYRRFKGKKDDVTIYETGKKIKKKKHITDREFINSVSDLIEEMMRIGLNRLTEIFIDKCQILNISARAVEMPRISRFLESIEDLIIKKTGNHAAFGTDALFLILSRLSALVRSIAHDIGNEDLRGVGSKGYPVYDHIQLSGLGCHAWETSSGFFGITAYFWEEKGKRILTWSDVRSKESSANFHPEEIYKNTSIWNSGISLYHLVRSSFRLEHPRINKLGRISLSQDTTCHAVIPNSSPAFAINPVQIKEWKLFFEIACKNAPLGLKEYNPGNDVIIIHPFEWCKREYNPLDQQFYWWLKDRKNDYICLKISYTGAQSSILDHLKSIKRQELRNFSVLGRINRENPGISLYPVSFINLNKGYYRQINIGLDFMKPHKIVESKRITEQKTGDLPDIFEAENDFHGAGWPSGSASFTLLRQVESELLKMAEKGTIHCWSYPSHRLEELGRQCICIGLPFLGKCIKRVFEEQKGAGAYFLFCRYLIHLHIQASCSGVNPGSVVDTVRHLL